MMINNSIRKMLSVIGVFVLIAAMALNFAGCSSKPAPKDTPAETTASATQPQSTEELPPETTESVQAETYAHAFTLTVVDLDGNETPFVIQTDREFVGEALLDEGIIAGDMGEYGLYITSVNGIAADWDKDMTYWAFYINGEYALTGVDTTAIDDSCAYSLVLTKG